MKKIILIASISALALSLSTNSLAKIYKWTDAKGVVHYSATPPASAKKNKKKVKDIEKLIRLAAGKHRPAQKDKKIEVTKQKKDKNETDSELSKPEKKLVDYCKNQKNNLKTLKSNFRNIWVDASGKKTKLNQKQRQQKVDYLKTRIEQDCKEVQIKKE